MQPLRDVFRLALGRGLRTLPEEDRLAAALPLVCGSALAAHCTVHSLTQERVVVLLVDGLEWLHSIEPMRNVLQHDLARVAAVRVTGVHFLLAGARPRTPRS